MEKLNFEFFDFFGATLPGVPTFIIICFYSSSTTFSYGAIHNYLKNTSLNESIVAVFACYAIGFCFHYPAYEIFQILVKKWGRKRTLGLNVSFGKRESELIKIREKNPENFKVINKFMALRQMAYTMMFSLFVFAALLTGLSIFKGLWNFEILFTLLLSISFAVLFLRRAVAFHERCQDMITKTFDILK